MERLLSGILGQHAKRPLLGRTETVRAELSTLDPDRSLGTHRPRVHFVAGATPACAAFPLYCLILLILAPPREASPIRPLSPKTKTITGLLSDWVS